MAKKRKQLRQRQVDSVIEEELADLISKADSDEMFEDLNGDFNFYNEPFRRETPKVDRNEPW